MKVFLKVIILFVGFIAFNPLFAYDNIQYDESYWPRSYYVNVGFGSIFTWGDLNERPITVVDSLKNKSKVYPPDMFVFLSPDISLGANIRCFSLDLNFQYSKTTSELVEKNESEDVLYWRLALEFMYNLFWGEDFQIGLGLAYSYTNLSIENSAFIGENIQSSHLMGSGFAFVVNAHYYITDYFAVVPSVRFYENWFKSVNSKATETCDLDPFIWQTYIFISIGLQYQF